MILLLLSTACSVGPAPGEYSPLATDPHGARGTLTLRGRGPVEIELVEVRDSALVVLAPDGYALARFRDIRGIELRPHVRWREHFRSDRTALTRLRRISRFPYGIPGSVLEQLLQSTSQTELIRLGADRG